MTIALTATQLTTDAVQLIWTTDLAGTTSWNVRRNIDGGGFTSVANLQEGTARQYVDEAPVLGASVVYRVVESPSTDQADAPAIIIRDLEVPFTFGLVDPLASTARYTTVDIVKARLGITHTEVDDQLLSAVVGAEVAIDQWNGRSFPDTGANPEIPGVPEAIRTWALDASIAIWKAADAPFGQGGSEAWLGALDIQNITERVLRRHPLSLGYKVTWGVA